MTCKLILMRHAKSDWSNTLSDYKRPLNNRGKKSSIAIGHWLREKNICPDQAFISAAQRTRDTWNLLGFQETDTSFLETLYHANLSALFNALKSASGKTVLILGHNPGIGQFAQILAKNLPNHPRFLDYPTCATWVATIDLTRWSDISTNAAETLYFQIPREII